jgi:ABC-type transport system involved in multi-copper enzyme maturation permease subunit
MTPVLLIAGNFVRENRWPLITLLVYVIVFGGGITFVGETPLEDAVYLLRSVGVYGLAFTALMAASGINNERRSRRILAVLSKGIDRGQYLGGLLLGTLLCAGIYCLTVGLIGSLALSRHVRSPERIWELVGVLIASFALVATVSLFFSTFLHPLMAAAAAAVTLTTKGGIARIAGGAWPKVLPSYTLAEAMVSFSPSGWHAPWTAAAWAIVHSFVFWVLATLVFSRRDIAVAVE